MANARKRKGNDAMIYVESLDPSNVITTGTTVAGGKYSVMGKGRNSNIPVPDGGFFIAPDSGSQITLVAGDRVILLDESRVCLTSVSYSLSSDAVDVGTDCDPAAAIHSGIVNVTGSISTLWQYDSVTDELTDVTRFFMNQFLPIDRATGTGAFNTTEKDENLIVLLTQVNSNSRPGQIATWLYCPIVITENSLGFSQGEGQSIEISFTKGQGRVSLFEVPIV